MIKKQWVNVLEILVEGGQRLLRQINDDKDVIIESLREENAELLKEIERKNAVQDNRSQTGIDSTN